MSARQSRNSTNSVLLLFFVALGVGTLFLFSSLPATWATLPQDPQRQTVPTRTPTPPPTSPKKNPDTNGDPIYLHSGEFYLLETDWNIPGRGFPFEFTRKYQSQLSYDIAGGSVNYDGPLGYNWEFNYNKRLVREASGNIASYDGYCRKDIYELRSSGTFTSPVGFYTELVKNADDTYTLLDADGMRTNFHGLGGSAVAGKLASIVDPNGNTMRFEYNALGQLVTVIDTLGRNITFRYNTAGRLNEVEDYIGRKILFEYDQRGDLVSVTQAADGVQRTTKYTYSSGYGYEQLNHNLLTVTAPNETVLEPDGEPYLVNVYGTNPGDPYSFDKVIQQTLGGTNTSGTGAGGTIALAYERILSSGDRNAPVNRTTITGRMSEVYVHEHNALGNRVTRYEYAQSSGSQTMNTISRTTRDEYNAHGERLKTVFPEGNVTESDYDDANPDRRQQGNMLARAAVPDPIRGGTPLTTTYTHEPTFNQVIRETNPAAQTTTYDYDGRGNLTTLTNALSYTTTHTYDEHGVRSGTTDPNGNKTVVRDHYLTPPVPVLVITPTLLTPTSARFLFDASSSWDAEDHTADLQVRWDWENDGQYDTGYTTTKTAAHEYATLSPNKAVRLEVLDTDHLTATVTAILPIQFVYLPLVAKDFTFRPGFDLYLPLIANGSGSAAPRSSATPRASLESQRSRSQPASSLPLMTRTAASTSTYQRTVTTTNALNQSTISVYDAYNNLVSVTDANGHTTTYEYDVFNQLIKMTDALGNQTLYTYDANGNRTSATDPNGHTTTYVYDILNQLVRTRDPLGNQTTYTYDANGNRTSVTEANGNTTRYFYDGFDRLIKVRDALGKETRYAYDSNDNLTSITDANGHTTTFKYDGFNRLIEERDPLSHGPTYTYDAAGNRKTRTDAVGQMTVYTYNAVNQLTKIDYPDDSDVTFEYDAVGNVKRTTDKNVDTHYAYDALNRLTSANYLPFNKTISYTYDPVGNRATMIDYDGGATTYGYDTANRLTTLTNPLSQVTTWQYDRAGRLTRKNYHNGTYATYTYADTNWLISLANKKSTGEVLSSYAYEYDKVGNRTKMTEADSGETNYRYDNLYQLTRVTYPDATTTQYQYDPVGNRQVMTDTTGTTLYTYDDANRLLTAGTVTYGWDNNGNQTGKVESGNTTTYTYDYENRLTGITFPDGSTNRFTYYPDGRRLSVTNKAGATTYYFYDGFNTLVETNSDGTTVARYTSGLGVDDWISMDKGAASHYHHRDGLGSVTCLSNAGEHVAASYDFDAFGILKSQDGSLVNPYKFTGRELDTDSALYFYRARYYDAQVGRFAQKDPLRLWTEVNHFAYVSNNPVNWVDPSGLCKKAIVKGAAWGAVEGLAEGVVGGTVLGFMGGPGTYVAYVAGQTAKSAIVGAIFGYVICKSEQQLRRGGR